MFSLEEFKNYFATEIAENSFNEEQLKYFYDLYLEDPLQFSGSMINVDSL